jgi:16S rRNA G966 N2-methylase RsmD
VKLNELFNEVAQKNSSLKSLSHQYRIRKPKAIKEIYLDPPFNTIEDPDLNNQISASHEEYLNTLTENGKLAEGN